MAITHTLTRAWGLGSSRIEKIAAVPAGAEYNIDETIGAAASDAAVACALDVSQIKSLFIVADAAMTLETNDGGAPVNTITLQANIPFLWIVGDAPLRDTAGGAITTDITGLFVTSAAGGLLQIRALVDPTV